MEIVTAQATAKSTIEVPLMDFEKAFLMRKQQGYALMLDIRLASGESMACPYAHLLDIRLRKGELILHFAAEVVTVLGRNLKEVYDVLREQRVEAIQEQGERYDGGEESEAYITKITVEDL